MFLYQATGKNQSLDKSFWSENKYSLERGSYYRRQNVNSLTGGRKKYLEAFQRKQPGNKINFLKMEKKYDYKLILEILHSRRFISKFPGNAKYRTDIMPSQSAMSVRDT